MKKIFLKSKWIVFIVLFGSLVACDKKMNFDLVEQKSEFGQDIKINNKVDLLFIIDNSSSMLQHQQRLSEQIDSLMNDLTALKMDYHLGVITTSMGGANKNGGVLFGSPYFLTSFTPNVLEEIKSRFVIGQGGSNNERGLESLMESLNEENLKIKYPDYLRPEAQLVIVVLTDEDDHSSNLLSIDVINKLNQIKPAFSKEPEDLGWVMHFIGVTSLSGSCRTYNQYADPGLKYMEIADYSRGLKESICSADLRTSLKGIQTRIIQILTDFYLTKLPMIETLKVYVNNQLINEDEENGWTYHSDLNMIRFHGSSVPPMDAQIVIDFKPKDLMQ